MLTVTLACNSLSSFAALKNVLASFTADMRICEIAMTLATDPKTSAITNSCMTMSNVARVAGLWKLYAVLTLFVATRTTADKGARLNAEQGYDPNRRSWGVAYVSRRFTSRQFCLTNHPDRLNKHSATRLRYAPSLLCMNLTGSWRPLQGARKPSPRRHTKSHSPESQPTLQGSNLRLLLARLLPSAVVGATHRRFLSTAVNFEPSFSITSFHPGNHGILDGKRGDHAYAVNFTETEEGDVGCGRYF